MMIWPFQRKRRIPATVAPTMAIALPVQAPDDPQCFGFKTVWWSLPTSNTAGVADAIQLQHPQPANWQTGIKYAYDGAVFITPTVHEWTFVTGFNLAPHTENAREEIIEPLLELSRLYGSALVFATHRVVEYHLWANAVGGSLIRGYGYLGESGSTFWDEGAMTPDELELGFAFFNDRSEEAADDSYWDREDLDFPNEMKVMEIAGKWSVSPLDLDRYKPTERRLGIIGNRSELLSK